MGCIHHPQVPLNHSECVVIFPFGVYIVHVYNVYVHVHVHVHVYTHLPVLQFLIQGEGHVQQ